MALEIPLFCEVVHLHIALGVVQSLVSVGSQEAVSYEVTGGHRKEELAYVV